MMDRSDSVVGDDLTLPVDINGSCRLPDSINAGENSTDSMTAPTFPDKMSPIKALTMKDYENQITALKKENFNLKLRIYFMEERMQQKCDDSTEDIFKTNIELKVELESMKRELAEKQELLVSASKALESLAGRESGEPHRVREQAQREMDALRDAFTKRIADLEQCLRTAEEEVESMAAIAEQEKLRSINMEKQLQVLDSSGAFTPAVPKTIQDLQQTLREKDNIIEQLKVNLKNQEALILQKGNTDQETDAPTAKQLSDLIAEQDQELKALKEALHKEKEKTQPDQEVGDGHVIRLESINKVLTEELNQVKSTNENLTKTLEDSQNQNKSLSMKLEEQENELDSEKKNALKRDKTIQGLTQVLGKKEKEIEELCQQIEDRDDALTKAREAAHKAQLQRYQGAEQHQSLLMEKQTELAQLQGEHHVKVLEAQKLQRALDRKEQELADLQQTKDQLDVELEDLQQQKKKGDKALNDLNNQLKKLSGEMKERESALEQQYQELLDQTKRKLQTHEATVQRLTTTLSDKEQQLQEYISMIRDLEQNRSPGSNDSMLTKLRQRLKEKENALEQALDEKFAAIEEKDNEIHHLQLLLREKERDLDRLNNLLTHNEETINSFDSLIKEKDVELEHLANTLKNLQRAKQDVEDNLNRSLREKDTIINQLQLLLEGKTKDMEEMSESTLNQSQTHAQDLTEQMGQRLKVTEAMLAEAVKARERLVSDNESAVEGLLATISSKDQLVKESAEHFNRMLSERAQEIQELKKQLAEKQQELANAEKQISSTVQKSYLEASELKALLADKDSLIDKLLQRGQERDQFLSEISRKTEQDHVLELRQTIQIMQVKLDEREAELSRRSSEDKQENYPLSKKTVVLKEELAQKTKALNEALKRENELKISLADLQSLLSELEGRIEGQAANIDSLTATLKTKEEIINVLHQRLGQGGHSRANTQDCVIGSDMERSLPELPQRERTMIGGDSQQETLPSFVVLHQEHDALNRALRAEQQLYSSLVRTVKEQDSAQRLHALQLELTAVQLLRQQLEDSIKTNEELRDDLEKEIHRAKLREGTDLIDPKELESVRHQLEDAQRWNASLQARLGAIQNRGGGVGGANDSGDTLSFIGDQTSYMSICVGEGADDSLSQLSVQELKQKVLDLQDCVDGLQSSNSELQSRLSQVEKSERDACEQEGKDLTSRSQCKQLEKTHEMQPLAHSNRVRLPDQDKESQTNMDTEEMTAAKLLPNDGKDSWYCQSREHAHSDTSLMDTRENTERNTDVPTLKSLLTDCGSTSVVDLREELLRLRSENAKLQGVLKEQKSTECKEKESVDISGNSSDGQAELRKSLETLQAEPNHNFKDSKLLKERAEKSNGKNSVSTAEEMDSPKPQHQTHSKRAKQLVTRHRTAVKSRLPVPVRHKMEGSISRQSVSYDQMQTETHQHLNLDNVFGSDQELHTDSDSAQELRTPPSSTLRCAQTICSPAGSDKGSEARILDNHSQGESALLTQLELLHQECQEKEVLINKMSKQLTDLEELHAQLQEKESLNFQYTKALQAAQSTIAYLTACSLDNQGGLGSHAGLGAVDSVADLHNRCMELQKALQEKEELNNHLIELLNMAEKAITSSHSQSLNPEARDLCLQIESALHQVNASSDTDSPRNIFSYSEESLHELQRHADSLQKALLEQSRFNAELQEQLRAANSAAQLGHISNSVPLNDTISRQRAATEESIEEEAAEEHPGTTGGFDNATLNQELSFLMNCFSAAESTVSSLAAHCDNVGSLTLDKPVEISPDLQTNLDNLQRVLLERRQLVEPTHPKTKSKASFSSASNKTEGLKLHEDLCLLVKMFSDYSQRISDLQTALQEEKAHTKLSEGHRMVQDAKGLPPNVKLQLETLHKALREKKKTCKTLEEKLATALTKTPSPETAPKAPEQGDKSVQVDLQDLGYETSGKSENDREENSITDLEVGVNHSCSPFSLPPLFKHEQANFSSTEHLESTSSTPYPSSPALSSAKVSLKGLQVYDEFGVSEDPLQLQAQVRELKVQLENQTKLILQMQSLLRRNSLTSDVAANTSDLLSIREQDNTQKVNQEKSGQLRKTNEAENQPVKDRATRLNLDLEKEKTQNQNTNELQQTRSDSTSPARLDSLVQSQAKELSQLRQQIKESRRLGDLQRRQLEELNKAFKDLLHASEVDDFMGEVIKEKLDKSLSLLDKLEGRLDRESHVENEDSAALELSHRLAKELQEKNRLIQSLQSQIRSRSPSSHHSSHSDLFHSDMSSSCHSSPSTQGGSRAHSQQNYTYRIGAADPPVGGAQEKVVSDHINNASRLQDLQRENGLLQEQLRSREELNATLRSELELHRSIMAQASSHHQEQEQGHDQEVSGPQTGAQKQDGDISSPQTAGEQPHMMNSDLLAEHLQEIRALRQRLEESIRTNDCLREQLERRLAEVEKDPAATNIFIHGNDEQGQLVNEVRYLWEQNQTLKEQLSVGSRDKQKENEKLRETLARRTAKLEQSRKECEALKQENVRLQERLEHCSQENSLLQNSLHSRKEELQRCAHIHNDSQLFHSKLFMEHAALNISFFRAVLLCNLKLHTATNYQPYQSEESLFPLFQSTVTLKCDSLLSEIKHLRLQLERSIQTNTALRQKLEEQLLRGPNRSETININYLLSSPDEGGRSPGREACDPLRHSFQSHHEHTSVLHVFSDVEHYTRSEVDGSVCSSSGDSISAAPSRLVPGHRMWANRNGRHILGLIEDYNALRKQISDGRKLSHSMDTQLQECLHIFRQQSSDDKVIERQHLKSLSSSSNTMQQVLEEAGRLLKLLWRISLPAGYTEGGGSNNQQDELLKNEITRLKNRLSQQERMLSGAVKRLRTTNQLKEGMEKVIIDQLSLTHGVLKKARGNLETNYYSLFGLKGLSGGPGEGGPGQWPLMDMKFTQPE
ncbi:CDK5 regulatory subunit-associated protein 2 [Nematolebias whitei]|uniref:CDK5 regulatory subunit-associated protein 2 n=1 Tax=Nematolebias whitei TaxID=451745 RepID=UPI0018988801|nr:CDK5 regulatory subunit-associated protein 2 [Nematolebias whitei]